MNLKKLLSRVRSRGEELITTGEYSSLFIGVILAFMGIYLLVSLISLAFGGELWTSIFFLNTDDAFMDFFNSIRDASQGAESYTIRKVIYPPMANLIFLLFSLITPDRYNFTIFKVRKTWVNYDSAVLLIVLYVFICTLLFALLIYKGLKCDKKQKWLFVAVCIFSIPFLNMMERGNIMVLALLSLMVYAITYDSPSKIIRELGLLALAFSFSLKLYPILFAWLLIGDKRYKEFFRCALYCVALLLLPSFAFGGVECLLIILKNIFSFSSGSKSSLAVISQYSHLPPWLVSGVAYLWFLLCTVNFVVSPFIYKERWKQWICGGIMFLAFPPLTSTYGWALFIIPMMMICNNGVKGKENLGYFLPLLIPFLPIPIDLPVQITVNAVIVYLGLVAISSYAMLDTWKTLRGIRGAKKEKAKMRDQI